MLFPWGNIVMTWAIALGLWLRRSLFSSTASSMWTVRLYALIWTASIVALHNQYRALTWSVLARTKEAAIETTQAPLQCSETAVTHVVIHNPPVNVQHDLADFLDGPGLQNSISNGSSSRVGERQQQPATAVCRFVTDPNSNHFPHAMQQLYRCWSYWRAANAAQPVLVWPHTVFVSYFNPQQQSLRTRFLRKQVPSDLAKSMIHAWQEAFGLKIVTPDHPLAKNNNAVYNKDVSYAPFVMSSPADARALADLLLSHRHYAFLDKASEQRRTTTHTTTPASTKEREPRSRAGCRHANGGSPRVVLLNRDMKSSRSFLNVNAIALELERALGLKVDVVYMEGRNFLEQITLFAASDLIVTVHGAQLTSLPFMPTCGAVFESFSAGYYLPWYFRSLAEASGIRHYSAYVGTQLETEQEWAMYNGTTRNIARHVNQCPEPLGAFVDVVKRMLDDWHECCRATTTNITAASEL